MTTIVNVKVGSIRPKWANLADWMSNPNHVYIGRKGIVFINGQRFPKSDSIWANPFRISTTDRVSCIKQYEEYMIDRLNRDPALVQQLKALKGKTLGCWCKPESCHGDVLINLIEKYE
jgi:hypothetical protein